MSEMVAGVVLGPSLFGALLPGWHAALFPKPSMTILFAVAQLGLAMYMFLVGVEFRSDLFRQRVPSALSVSVAGIVAPFALGGLIALGVHADGTMFRRDGHDHPGRAVPRRRHVDHGLPRAGADRPRARALRDLAGHPGACRGVDRRCGRLVRPRRRPGEPRRRADDRRGNDRGHDPVRPRGPARAAAGPRPAGAAGRARRRHELPDAELRPHAGDARVVVHGPHRHLRRLRRLHPRHGHASREVRRRASAPDDAAHDQPAAPALLRLFGPEHARSGSSTPGIWWGSRRWC